jgi:hypothetical protein
VAWIDTTRGGDGSEHAVAVALLPNASYDARRPDTTGLASFLPTDDDDHAFPQHYAMLYIPPYRSGGQMLPERFVPLRGVDVRLDVAGGAALGIEEAADSAALVELGDLEPDYAKVRPALLEDTLGTGEAAPAGPLAARVVLDKGTRTATKGYRDFAWWSGDRCPVDEDTHFYAESVAIDLGAVSSASILLTGIADPSHRVAVPLSPPDDGALQISIWNKTATGHWHHEEEAQRDTHYDSFLWYYALSQTRPQSAEALGYPCRDDMGGDRCPPPKMLAP